MANLASSAVTIINSWTEGSVTGKRLTGLNVILVLTGQGGGTNLIPASALGLDSIERCTNFVKSDDSIIYNATPDHLNGGILLSQGASSNAPADITATVYGCVWGPLKP